MFMLTVNTLTKILFAVETSKKVPNLKCVASDCRESFGKIRTVLSDTTKILRFKGIVHLLKTYFAQQKQL